MSNHFIKMVQSILKRSSSQELRFHRYRVIPKFILNGLTKCDSSPVEYNTPQFLFSLSAEYWAILYPALKGRAMKG